MASEKYLSSDVEVAIIGTGLYGIQAARYYLDVHPEAKMAILESDDVVGGTWSSSLHTRRGQLLFRTTIIFFQKRYGSGKTAHIAMTSERIYDDFWTQTPIKMAEFSDRPMAPPPAEDQYWGFFPAKYTTAYLESYVDNHTYNGRTIRDRIIFNAPVQHVEKSLAKGQWTISHSNGRILKAEKLIDATGMTSEPYVPALQGTEIFQGLALHHKQFGQSDFLSDATKQHIVVLGGGKSAADVAYASAKAGKTVSWVIREDGNGPAAFFAPQPVSKRYANSNEGFYNRFLASFLPNPFGRKGLLAKILHGTWFGRRYLKNLWDGFDRGLRGVVDYQREEGKDMGFANLEPDTPIFWQNDSSGVNTRPDLLSTIATKVHVYRQEIHHLSVDSVVLAPRSGSEDKPTTIAADVLVYCTGWSPTSNIFPPEQGFHLGLSVPLVAADPKIQSRWQALEDAADPHVLSRFPHLGHPPAYRRIEPTHTPFRLYKAMAPVVDAADHSIVFLGKMVVGNNFRTAEAQALWAVGYLDGKIAAKPEVMEQDVAMTVAWDRRRYLNKGQLGSWFYFDVVAYADMLLEQLGLSSHRKKGWFGNLMDPCVADDLKGLAKEYKDRKPS